MPESSSEFRYTDISVDYGYHDYRQLACHGRSLVGTISGFGRRWFVKSIVPSLASSTQARQSLIKEYEILLSLNHPGVVRVIELTEIPDVGLSIIMEYVEGLTLAEALPDLHKRERRQIASRLLETIAFIHSKGITHGDLKPQNIIVGNTGGEIKTTIIDFNLSDSPEFETDKESGGNRKYGAPEQFQEGYQLQPTADVYSAGKIIRELAPGFTWRHAVRKALSENPGERPRNGMALLNKVNSDKRAARIFIYLSLIIVLAVLPIAFLGFPRQESGVSHTAPIPHERVTEEIAPLGVNDDSIAREPQVASSDAPISMREDVKIPSDAGTKSFEESEFARLDKKRQQTELKIREIFSEFKQKILAVQKDSTSTPREKRLLINDLITKATTQASSHWYTFAKECPYELLINPPEKWRDLISKKEHFSFYEFVTSVYNSIK